MLSTWMPRPQAGPLVYTENAPGHYNEEWIGRPSIDFRCRASLVVSPRQVYLNRRHVVTVSVPAKSHATVHVGHGYNFTTRIHAAKTKILVYCVSCRRRPRLGLLFVVSFSSVILSWFGIF